MAKRRTDVEAGTGNVFADLGYADARERSLKVELAMEVNRVLEERGLAQGQAPELSVSVLVCRARLSRQTGHGEQRQEDVGDGWRTLGDPGEESQSDRAYRPLAGLPARALTAALHPQEERQTASALDPRPD